MLLTTAVVSNRRPPVIRALVSPYSLSFSNSVRVFLRRAHSNALATAGIAAAATTTAAIVLAASTFTASAIAATIVATSALPAAILAASISAMRGATLNSTAVCAFAVALKAAALATAAAALGAPAAVALSVAAVALGAAFNAATFMMILCTFNTFALSAPFVVLRGRQASALCHGLWLIIIIGPIQAGRMANLFTLGSALPPN